MWRMFLGLRRGGIVLRRERGVLLGGGRVVTLLQSSCAGVCPFLVRVLCCVSILHPIVRLSFEIAEGHASKITRNTPLSLVDGINLNQPIAVAAVNNLT